VSTSKIGNMHMIEVVDDDQEIYQFPVTAVEDVPRQEWFDLMVECGGFVSCVYSPLSSVHAPSLEGKRKCPICIAAWARIDEARDKQQPSQLSSQVVTELLGWLDQIAAQGMSFRARLMKNRGEG
jgi:hypothetical protein